ncbi:hypothetical protein Thi970DRAFT_03434 [Thiorhodovibrio frisius]|uniref:Uncharacterized protein n=1 Tax=Thiorhodovibrio frisius TaxID=631362 RepID=H8Z7B4_9GAMM|nr:hypothetical protein Thi970DRAFT_03434 [Thiorhodovibrio frisius]WPL20558.1 hypothetical protein Thiofri_00657 [Thiorhodovibrio frisius]
MPPSLPKLNLVHSVLSIEWKKDNFIENFSIWKFINESYANVFSYTHTHFGFICFYLFKYAEIRPYKCRNEFFVWVSDKFFKRLGDGKDLSPLIYFNIRLHHIKKFRNVFFNKRIFKQIPVVTRIVYLCHQLSCCEDLNAMQTILAIKFKSIVAVFKNEIRHPPSSVLLDSIWFTKQINCFAHAIAQLETFERKCLICFSS